MNNPATRTLQDWQKLLRHKFVVTMLIVSIMSSCGWARDSLKVAQQKEESPTAVEQAEAYVAERKVRISQQVTRAHKIRVPRSAPWLTDPIQVRYRDLAAEQVIHQLAQKRPIKLTFVPREVVTVSAPISAVSIEDHLNAICQQANWSYRVHDGVVLIYDIETATFPLSIQPGNTSAVVSLRGLNSSGGEDDGDTSNELSVSLNPYVAEVEALLAGILGLEMRSSAGGDRGESGAASRWTHSGVDPRTGFSILPSANSVVVTAQPQQMRIVADALSKYNLAASRSVMLRIAVFEVEISGGTRRSLDLNAIRDAAVSVGVNVLPERPDEINSSLSFLFNEGNRYDGSEAILNWLRRQGETRIAFRDMVEVRNNAVGSVDATQTRQYVKRIYDNSEAFGGSTFNRSNVEFNELRTGWAIHVQPTISNDLVTVRLGISRSTFVDEQPYSFDDGRVEGTNFITDDYNRVMAVSLLDGQTRLITSLSNTEDRREQQRTPWLPWLGDGITKSDLHRETVMVLTADVL